MEYNTNRKHLALPEYGRIVQDMVDYAVGIKDAGRRQHCAEAIIRVMARINPGQNGSNDFEHALWDHLMYISNYRLDVKTPFPITRQNDVEREHPHLDYPHSHPRYRHYGATLEAMVKALKDIPEGKVRDEATLLVVAQMAKSLYVWNRAVLTPEKLQDDVRELSHGAVSLNLERQQLLGIINQAAQVMRVVPSKKKRR